MSDFFTFLQRKTPTIFRKDGSQVSFEEDGSITVKTNGDFNYNIAGEDKKTFADIKPRLTLNDYQTGAISTAIYKDEYKVIYPALKLTGEAGEVSEKIGKVLRDKDGEFTDEVKTELAKELGDVLWYIAALARDIGYSLEEIGQMNLDKLASRKARNVINGSGDNR